VVDVDFVESNGYSIAYSCEGSGEHDILIIPGWISHLDFPSPAMEAFIERLSRFARVIRLDKRGTGLSDRVDPEDTPTLEERDDDVLAVLDAVGSRRATIFGASEGGPMSILLAAMHPGRVDGLVLYGTYAKWLWESHGGRHFGDTVEDYEAYLLESWGRETQFEVLAPSLVGNSEFEDQWRRLMRMSASPTAAAAIHRMALDIDVTAVLPTVSVPTVLVHVSGDRFVPVELGREVAAGISGARIVEVPGEDHVGIPYDVIGDELELMITGQQAPVHAERVLATVLFTDIEDSTRTAAQIGDKAWRTVLDTHDRISAQGVTRNRGRLIKSTGDGVLASFDGPARAVRCAQELHRSLQDAGMTIRAGVHTGEVELRGEDIGGIGVHIAARVASLASGGQTLVTRTVKDLTAGSGLVFQSLGERELKGIPEPWDILEVNPDS
jgi:class 3 adenylate cyclase/pimeloyl-ACP methyl ester carboxylesterase